MILLLIARVLISLIFLISGINKIIHWESVEKGLTKTLTQWQVYMEGFSFAQEILEFLLPLVPLLLIAATFFELAGGVLAIFRKYSRWGAVFFADLFDPCDISLSCFLV